MYDIPFDRSFLQLSNGIRHVMPSTDKARINSKGIDGSKRLTDDCVFQFTCSIILLSITILVLTGSRPLNAIDLFSVQI